MSMESEAMQHFQTELMHLSLAESQINDMIDQLYAQLDKIEEEREINENAIEILVGIIEEEL